MNRWLAALLLCIPTLTSLLPIPPQHYPSALYNKDVASITSADMNADSSELLDLSAWAKQRTLSEEAINSEHLVFGVQQGEKLTFSPSQIENRLECSQGTLLGITVTSLPSQSSGQLLLDGQPLANWSYLSREQIENLTFEPSPNATEANFSFLHFLSTNEYENAMSA